MARIPYSMQTLITQVFEHKEDAEINVEEEDGLGVYRRVTFDPMTSRWLEPIISLIAPKDDRIKSFFTSRGGMLMIDFDIYPSVETREPFAIPEVDRVLNAPDEPDEPAQPAMKFEMKGTATGEAPPDKETSKPAKKAPAKKKAAAKKTSKKPDLN